MQTELSKNILATVVYYDILDYPLTSFEIWKYLISYNTKHIAYSKKDEITLADVIKELENDEIKKNLEEYQGFYFLKGRKELAKERKERNKISEKKFKIIKRAVWWLRFVPFIRTIAVTGRMAMKNADWKSDLDLFVVIKSGHIFTGRMLVTGLVHILGIRRYGKKIANRVCLNYFVTDESLEISLKDLFSSSEYSFIVPVFGWEVFRHFKEKNMWIKNYRINYIPQEGAGWKLVEDSFSSKLIRGAGELIFNIGFVENLFKKFQMNRITKDPRTYKTGSYVTANDRELVFLPEPQGPKIFSLFEEKLKKIV
jgi:hypothetical protein